MNGQIKRISRLMLVTAGLWLAAALPAWLIADVTGLEGLTYALLMCLLPGIAALWFVKADGRPHQALASLLIGMLGRMAFVFAGTMVLRRVRPDLGPSAFHIWVIVGYLVMLWVETRMLLADNAGTRHGSEIGQPTA
jgi:hypothetical protein